MANAMFCLPNWVDGTATITPVLSGGSWDATQSLDKLAQDDVNDSAYSTAVTTVATQGEIDLGAPRDVRAFAISNHNISNQGLFRIRASNTAGDFSSPEYDSGWFDAVPIIYPFGSLFWGHPSFWTGKPTDEDRIGAKFPIIKTFDLVLARYWKFEIDDTANSDGYIRLDRLFIARGIQPTFNMAYGQTNIGWVSNTKVSVTNSQRRIYQEKRNRRSIALEIQNLTYAEAFANYFDMQGERDIFKQLFFIFDPDDTALMHRRAFLATMNKANPLQFPYFNRNNVPLELLEVI